MSPYEVPPPASTLNTRQATIQQWLAKYDVTSNGFLPEELPLQRLPDPYYAPWERLMHKLASYIQDNALRTHVDDLPVLSLDRLKTKQEQRRAYLILTFFLHGYVWGSTVPSENIPPSVSTPLLELCENLGLPPIATFSSFNLWNFTSSSPTLDFTDAETLHALHTFTGTEDESWFYMISVAIEAQGAYIIPILLQGLDSLHKATPTDREAALKTATKSLDDLKVCIIKMGHILDKMGFKCDPDVFYHRIRPFLAGSKNMAAAGLPRGLFYDEGPAPDDHDGTGRRGEYRQLRGGSNGQSSLIQFLDIVLGVEHSNAGNSAPETATSTPGQPRESGRTKEGIPGAGLSEETISFHQEVRDYMPREHRKFLERVMDHGGGGFRRVIEQLIASSGENVAEKEEQELKELIDAFKAAITELVNFRQKHLLLVTKYIILPAQRHRNTATKAENSNENEMAAVVNLATVSTTLMASSSEDQPTTKDNVDHGNELTGTGGTALIPFLKQSRDETKEAGILGNSIR
ncbi:Indoleamine 2,3-dioxygenase [Naviculisporaceae sp. PSN 640]